MRLINVIPSMSNLLLFVSSINREVSPLPLFCLSLSLSSSLWTEPESVPASGEQCKHPGLSSGPAGPDRTRPPASTSASTFPPRHSKSTTITSLSAGDWWHTGISFTAASCFWVTVTTRWKQSTSRVLSFPTLITGEEVREGGKKRRSNNEEVTVEVKHTAIAVILEDKRWELSCWTFTGLSSPCDAPHGWREMEDFRLRVSFLSFFFFSLSRKSFRFFFKIICLGFNNLPGIIFGQFASVLTQRKYSGSGKSRAHITYPRK